MGLQTPDRLQMIEVPFGAALVDLLAPAPESVPQPVPIENGQHDRNHDRVAFRRHHVDHGMVHMNALEDE